MDPCSSKNDAIMQIIDFFHVPGNNPTSLCES